MKRRVLTDVDIVAKDIAALEIQEQAMHTFRFEVDQFDGYHSVKLVAADGLHYVMVDANPRLAWYFAFRAMRRHGKGLALRPAGSPLYKRAFRTRANGG